MTRTVKAHFSSEAFMLECPLNRRVLREFNNIALSWYITSSHLNMSFCLPQKDAMESLVFETSLRESVVAKAKTMVAAAVKKEATAMAVTATRK